MSEQARLEILKQLSDGKLSADEAAVLLRALGGSSDEKAAVKSGRKLPAKKVRERSRKLQIRLNGRAVKNGPHTFTLPLGFLDTIRNVTDMIPAVRNLIMWDALNLVGGELADITISVD